MFLSDDYADRAKNALHYAALTGTCLDRTALGKARVSIPFSRVAEAFSVLTEPASSTRRESSLAETSVYLIFPAFVSSFSCLAFPWM